MGLVEELQQLEKLRESGALTEDEFSAAKRKLLSDAPADNAVSGVSSGQPQSLFEENRSLGEAANRYVTFRIVMTIVGLLLFLFFASRLFGVFHGIRNF